MPGRAEQLSYLETFHTPAAPTYTETPAQVQTRTGLLPVLSMPASDALEDTVMARAQPAVLLREKVFTCGTLCWIPTPLAHKVLECAEGLYWSPLWTQPPPNCTEGDVVLW